MVREGFDKYRQTSRRLDSPRRLRSPRRRKFVSIFRIFLLLPRDASNTNTRERHQKGYLCCMCLRTQVRHQRSSFCAQVFVNTLHCPHPIWKLAYPGNAMFEWSPESVLVFVRAIREGLYAHSQLRYQKPCFSRQRGTWAVFTRQFPNADKNQLMAEIDNDEKRNNNNNNNK